MWAKSALLVGLVAGADAFGTSIGLGGFSAPSLRASTSRPTRGGVVGLNAKLSALLFDCDGVLADTVPTTLALAFSCTAHAVLACGC